MKLKCILICVYRKVKEASLKRLHTVFSNYMTPRKGKSIKTVKRSVATRGLGEEKKG